MYKDSYFPSRIDPDTDSRPIYLHIALHNLPYFAVVYGHNIFNIMAVMAKDSMKNGIRCFKHILEA